MIQSVSRLLLVWLFLYSSFSKAETITTDNKLIPVDEWTLEDKASNSQCSYSGTLQDGEVCTGSANTTGVADGGGQALSPSLSLITDYGLTIDELQNGFDIDFGVTVESHISNQTVPTCANTNSDCKDVFSVTVNFTEQDGNLVETINHIVEMNYSGQQDFIYNHTILPNSYTDLFTQMTLFGTDAGFTNGYYGAIFSQAYLQVTYQTIDIVTDIIDDIVNDIIEDSFIELDIEPINVEIEFDNFEIDTLEFEINLQEDFESIEMIETLEMPIVDSDMEINIGEAIEELETIEESFEEITDNVEQSEELIQEDVEQDNEPNQSIEEEEQTDESQEEATEETEERVLVAEKKLEIKQKLATKILQKNKDQTSLEYQTLQIAVMNALTPSLQNYELKTIPDNTVWYENKGVYTNQLIINDVLSNNFTFTQDKLMSDLENLQWQN